MSAVNANWQKRKTTPPTNRFSPSSRSLPVDGAELIYELVGIDDLDSQRRLHSSAVQAVIGEAVVIERYIDLLASGHTVDEDDYLTARKVWEMEEEHLEHLSALEVLGEEHLKLIRALESSEASLKAENDVRANLEALLERKETAAEMLSLRLVAAENLGAGAEERARIAQQALDCVEEAIGQSEQLANRVIESSMKIEVMMQHERELRILAEERLRDIDEKLGELLAQTELPGISFLDAEVISTCDAEFALEPQEEQMLSDYEERIEEKRAELRRAQIDLQTTLDEVSRKQEELAAVSKLVAEAHSVRGIFFSGMGRWRAKITCYLIGIIFLTIVITFLMKAALADILAL